MSSDKRDGHGSRRSMALPAMGVQYSWTGSRRDKRRICCKLERVLGNVVRPGEQAGSSPTSYSRSSSTFGPGIGVTSAVLLTLEPLTFTDHAMIDPLRVLPLEPLRSAWLVGA